MILKPEVRVWGITSYYVQRLRPHPSPSGHSFGDHTILDRKATAPRIFQRSYFGDRIILGGKATAPLIQQRSSFGGSYTIGRKAAAPLIWKRSSLGDHIILSSIYGDHPILGEKATALSSLRTAVGRSAVGRSVGSSFKKNRSVRRSSLRSQ